MKFVVQVSSEHSVVVYLNLNSMPNYLLLVLVYYNVYSVLTFFPGARARRSGDRDAHAHPDLTADMP